MLAKLISFLVLALLWGTIKYAFAFASAEPCTRRFEVGLADYAPVSYRDEGKLKGVGHDIARQLAHRTGCAFAEKPLPRPAAISQMKLGRLDLFLLTGSLIEFDKMGGFVPLYDAERTLTVLSSVNGSHQTIEAVLNDPKIKFGLMIGSQTTFTTEEYQKLLQENRTVDVPGADDLFRLLKMGKVQAVMFTSSTTSYYLKKLKLESLTKRFVDPNNKATVGYIYSKRRMSEQDKELIYKTMQVLKTDGTLAKIFKMHYSSQASGELRIHIR